MNIPDATDVTDVTNHEQVTRHLLKANANIEVQNTEGGTALMFAAQNGHENVLRKLIKAGASLESKQN